MTKQKIIAFAAQMRNGKDTAADYLATRLNSKIPLTRQPIAPSRDDFKHNFKYSKQRWERQAFANAVKSVFEDAFGEDRAFTEEWKSKSVSPDGYDMAIRPALQFIGSGFRTIKSDIWIEVALRHQAPLIISDARYLNELQAVYERGGVNILLWRPGFENDDPNDSEAEIKPLVDWAKETQTDGLVQHDIKGMPHGMQYVHIFLKSGGSIEDLYDQVDKYIVPYVEKRW